MIQGYPDRPGQILHGRKVVVLGARQLTGLAEQLRLAERLIEYERSRMA